MTSKRFPWFGVFLIVVGAGLLLDRLQIVTFGWQRIFWSVCAVCGFGMVIMGFVREYRGHVFWGTILFLYGVFFTLRYFNTFEYHIHLFIPVSLVIIGLAFVMRVVYAPRDWSMLIPGTALVGLGTLLSLAEFGYIDRYDIWHNVRLYWPVLLVLLGLALFFKRKET